MAQLPAQAGAVVRVIVFDAVGRQTEAVVQVGMHFESITAVFTGGTLTITGDDPDNTITVSRDTAGTILVNGSAVPVPAAPPPFRREQSTSCSTVAPAPIYQLAVRATI